MKRLIDRIADKSAVLGVIGLGYVGLPLAVQMAAAGYQVIGIDVSEEKVRQVNRGQNYIGDISDNDLASYVSHGALRATTDFSVLSGLDCVCIAVPTPLDVYQQPDMTCIKSSMESIVPYLHKGMLVVLESTTYPGTTEEFVKPLLESSGLECGKDFFLAYSPERVDPGNQEYKTSNTPKVVGGVTETCCDLAASLYEGVLHATVHKVSSPAIAEMEKILENAYRNINIGLVNELAILCNRMNISIWEVIDAARSKPYGFQAFYPGPGLGGHCIPLDPYYLSWKAREFGFHTSMIEASMTINDGMPEYCVQRAVNILNKHHKPLRGSRILMLGVAYKKDVDDCRESPAIRIYEKLLAGGAQVVVFDPQISEVNHKGAVIKGQERLTRELVENSDLVIIATGHTNVDYDLVVQYAKAVFDTRGVTKELHGSGRFMNIELL